MRKRNLTDLSWGSVFISGEKASFYKKKNRFILFINYLEISAQPAVLNKGWLEKYKNVLEGPWSVPKMFPVSHKVENNWLHRPTAKQIILKELKKKCRKIAVTFLRSKREGILKWVNLNTIIFNEWLIKSVKYHLYH